MSNPFESSATPAIPTTYRFSEIRRIGVLSCGKMLGALYAIMGLLVGGLFTLISLAGAGAAMNAANAPNGPDPTILIGFGAASIIILPLFYGVIGFIFGVIMGFFYNLIAGAVGGIEIQLDE